MDKKIKYDMVFDLDETILQSVKTIINLYNKKHNKEIEIDYSELDWNFKPYAKTEEEINDMLKLFIHKDFYDNDNILVFPHIIDIINNLCSQGYKIAICSKQCEERRLNTIAWGEKFLPNVEFIFVKDFKDKGQAIGKTKIFFDDRIDSLESMKENAQLCVCVGNYKWNKEWNGVRQNPFEWNNILYNYSHILEKEGEENIS